MSVKMSGKRTGGKHAAQAGYQVERVYAGTRSAKEVVADLIKVHTR